MYYLGVDLGGTNTAAAVVDETGRLYAKTKEKTPKTGGPEAVAECICKVIREAAAAAGLPLKKLESVGIGAPGIVDPSAGLILNWSGRSFQNVPLRDMVEKRLHLPVLLENDANAAALGEFSAGAGKGVDHMVMVTLGTGIGGGIIIGGKLYSGYNRAAGELGHIVIQPNGVPCSCGRRGCFEAYASATALVRQTREKMQSTSDSALWTFAGGGLSGVTGRTAFEAMRAGDAAGAEVIKEFCSYLASGIVSIINLLQPEVLCVGGGLSGEGEDLLRPVREILDREDYAQHCTKRTKLAAAALGNDAGLVGAALLPFYQTK